MSEQLGERVETGAYTLEQEHLERLVRYGERLATGILPVVGRTPDYKAPPEPVFERYPNSQHHELDLPLSGLLVGNLNVSLVEGEGVAQLFLNLNYVFPRTYLVASRTAPRLTPIRVSGRSYFIDNHERIGAVAHVCGVYEDSGDSDMPFWALSILDRYQQKPWPVLRCYRAADAVGAFQRALSRDALQGIQTVYDEVAAEYGFVQLWQFRWRQFRPTVI